MAFEFHAVMRIEIFKQNTKYINVSVVRIGDSWKIYVHTIDIRDSNYYNFSFFFINM